MPGQVQEFLTAKNWGPKTDQITGFSFYKKRNSSKCGRRSSREDKECLRHSSRLNNSDTGITTAATSTTTRSTAAANDRAGWHHGHSRTQRKVFTMGDNVSIQLCSGLVFTLTDPDKWHKGKSPGRGEEKNRWFTGTITFFFCNKIIVFGCGDWIYLFTLQHFMKQYIVDVFYLFL